MNPINFNIGNISAIQTDASTILGIFVIAVIGILIGVVGILLFMGVRRR